MSKHPVIPEFSNQKLPELRLSAKGLEPVTGVLGIDRAAHLLNRCLFGPKVSEMEQFKDLDIVGAMDLLLTDSPVPDPPVSIDEKDTDVALGETWINASYNSDFRGFRLKSLRSWWLGLIVNQEATLTEKMTLFWHNHFVTETNVVNRSVMLYKYTGLLRSHSLGNFRQFAKEMTVNPSMLKYLDGDENIAGKPNENYARELFELFTIGKGPLIGEGDYTNYTENDVQEAARVLSGWKLDFTNSTSWFNSSKHDKESKVFSAHLGAPAITNLEEEEYKALIDMIFAQKETARNMVRKLYRWFVYYIIDENVETNVIEPLATLLYGGDYEIKPVLHRLLGSEHFFDTVFRGAYIKNPYEHIAGSLRRLEVAFSEDYLSNYLLWNTLFYQASNQEMKLGEPPDVAGWTQWYMAPQFNQLWINSATIPQKSYFTDKLINSGWTQSGFKIIADPLAIAETVSDPSDPQVLIREFARLLYPVIPDQEGIDALKEVLIPGLPDFEWRDEWNKYKQDPADTDQKKAVENMLKDLFKVMLRSPEYCLI